MDMHDERREDLTQPGVAENSPRDTDGTGPAGLPDRTKPGGQGIGLTVVQEILANHRFDYALESAAGGPTRFTIRF